MQKRRGGKMPPMIAAELLLIVALAVTLVCVTRGGHTVGRTDAGQSAAQSSAEPEDIYMVYGAGSGTELNTSGFVAPDTKNNLDLVAFVQQAWEHQWGYVWGTFGYVLDESRLADKLLQYPEGVGDFEEFIRANWLGRRTADCIGLLKAYFWFDAQTGSIDYNAGGLPDCGTEELFDVAEEKGTIDTIPELPGVIVYREGHVGVYIGDNYVIEAAGTENGVVKTKLSEQPFTDWFKCPNLVYYE